MDQELASLVEMFPSKPVQDLRAALESSDFLVADACAMLLSEQQQIKEDPLEQLQAMFPNLDAETVRKVYQDQGGSDSAIAELLNHDLLVEERELERQRQQKREQQELEDRNPHLSGPQQCVETVRKYTGVSEAVAKQASYRSSFFAIKAIIAIIESHGAQGPTQKRADMPEIKARPKQIGGRVQGARGMAHANSFMTLRPNEEDDSTEVEQPYVYSKYSEEGRDLDDAIQSNLDLRGINPKFLRHSLEFYRGDVEKTLLLAMFLLEHKAAHYTHKDPLEPADVSGFTEVQPRRSRSPAGSPAPVSLSLCDEQCLGTARGMVQDVLVNPRLDFHGFLCSDALLVLQMCLSKWWDEEMAQRELNSQKLSMIDVANVSPLKVITGRGIHSNNGVSKLKQQVRQFLNKNNYKYLEDTAYFIVLGKKNR